MATYKAQTGLSIDQAFDKFHKANPHIYELFKKKVDFLINTVGKTTVSSKHIINNIRWDSYIKTASDDGYKINDAFTSRYSRLYAKDFPEREDYFIYKKLRS